MSKHRRFIGIPLAALWAVGLIAQATPLPPEQQWLGFPVEIPSGVAGQPADALTLYFNSARSEPAGTISLPGTGAAAATPFNYKFAYPLFGITRVADPGAVAIFETTPTPVKLYQGSNFVPPPPPPNTNNGTAKYVFRLVAVEGGASAKVRFDKSFDLPIPNNLPQPAPGHDATTDYLISAAGQRALHDALVGTLNAKTLKDLANPPMTAGQTAAVRPAGAVPPPRRDTPGPDALSDAVNKMFKDNKAEAAFIYFVAKNADSAAEPDKTRLLAQRTQLLADAQKDWSSSQDDPPSVNQWRSDAYVKDTISNHVVTPNPAISAVLQARGVTNDDVMNYFCPSLPKKLGSVDGSTSFNQARSAAITGNLAANQGRPEDVRGASAWDRNMPTAQAKCNEFYNAAHPDPRAADQTGQGNPDGNAAAGTHPSDGLTGPTGGDGRFHPAPEPPPDEKKKTNPLKNYIFGAKTGIWLGLLGFIFGGPAGALVMGAAGAGLGYWMSSYK